MAGGMTDAIATQIGGNSPPKVSTLGQLWRLGLICAGCAIAIIAGSILALYASLLVSNDSRIRTKLDAAFDRGVLSQEFIPVSPYGHAGHTYDMYTECVALGQNFMNSDTDILKRIAASPALTIFGKPCERLHAAVKDGQTPLAENYLRFWHGYQVYMRPMLTYLSVEKYRQITAVLLFGVMIFFASRLARDFGAWAWPVSLVPFFLVGDFLSVPIITSHALSLAWIFLSVAVAHVILEKFPDKRMTLFPAFVFSAGMITNFLSFLVNPPLAPALIGFLVIASDTGKSSRNVVATVTYAAGNVALWYVGYGVEWVAKWMLAMTVVGPEAVLNNILGHIDLYEADLAKRGAGLLRATFQNFTVNSYFIGTIALSMLGAAAIVTFAAVTNRVTRQHIVDFLLMLSPLLSIIVWIELNASHSLIHTGFVSRSTLLFAVVPLLAAIVTWKRGAKVMSARPPIDSDVISTVWRG
jgi:hypothetical protein